MKKQLLTLFLILLLAACSGPDETSSEDLSTESATVEEASAEEAVEEAPAEETVEEAPAEEAVEEAPAEESEPMTAENVEITLIDPLDGVTNSYCIDIAGGNEDVDPANGLQAHTCYSYQGDLGSDQVFDTAGFASGTLYMPVYDVCAQVASASAGAEVGLATCDGSELQTFVFGDGGTISPASDTSLCVTASSETRFGRSDVHQIKDIALAACSDDLAAYQQWGSRTSLDDEITVLASTGVMSEETMDDGEDAESASDETADNTNSAVAEDATAPTTFQLEAWSDNWFAAYLNETLIVEDSVSINTERSFNAETTTFEASYPLNLNFILKDFKENDTGLEYIGERNQQMGDGGFIMQLTDMSTGNVVAVSDDSFMCTVIHTAPLDKSCESESNPTAGTAPCTFEDLGEPDGWMSADFDDSVWTATTIHTSAAVDPKQGYDNISWDGSQLAL